MKDYNIPVKYSETYILELYHKYMEIYENKEHEMYPPLKFIGNLIWHLKQYNYENAAKNLAFISGFYDGPND